MAAKPAIRKAAENLVQAICADSNAAAVSVIHYSLSELRHIHGTTEKINENAAAMVSSLDKADVKAEALSKSNEKLLSAIVDLKGAVVKSARIHALQWAITYVKSSQPHEVEGNFDYYSACPPQNISSSKPLVLSILFTFMGGKGRCVTGYVGLENCFHRAPSNEAKTAAEAKFKKLLSEQITALTGLETKYVPQSDGRVAIFLAT